MVEVKSSTIEGRGVFAKQDIPKDTLIGTYRGRKAKRDGRYVLWVEDTPYYIRNKFRYANHSKTPNTEVIEFDMYSIRNINQGEELTLDYGEDWE